MSCIFFEPNRAIILRKTNTRTVHTGTLWKVTVGQVSQPFCTKDPNEKKNYSEVLEIFCTARLPWPPPLSLTAVDDIAGDRRKRQQLPGQQKLYRPKALRRAAIEEDHESTSAGNTSPTSMAMDPTFTRGARGIRPPPLHKTDHCPAA